MALDKFINSVRTEVAKRFDLKTDAEIDAFFLGMEESAKDNLEVLEKRNKMLRDTVSELCEAKRLLKLAVEDFKEINSDILTCKYCKWYSAETDECTYYPDDTPCETICGWKHEGEALKLIGETNDEP